MIKRVDSADLEGYKLNDKVLERCLEKYGKEKVEILGNSSTDHPYPVALKCHNWN